MKNKHTPLLLQKSMLTPFSLYKTRSQLIKDTQRGVESSSSIYESVSIIQALLHLIKLLNRFHTPDLFSDLFSERDFADQLWLPVFQKLFHINEEIIRIKVEETVLEGSTESKIAAYSSYQNLVGFKVDMRFFFDFEGEVFDLGCAEACMASASEDKLKHDMSKLFREGKLMQAACSNILPDSNVFSWVIQISGLTACFYTVHATKHNYHVCIPQFTAMFPSSYSQLESFYPALENLVMFRDSIEDLATKINAAILDNRKSITEDELQEGMDSSEPEKYTVINCSPIYHTPPHNNHSILEVPNCIYEKFV